MHRTTGRKPRWSAIWACLALLSASALAEELDRSIQAAPIGQWTGWRNRGNLLGDMGGLRTALGRDGITLGITETSEYLGNVSGGVQHGFYYDGLTTVTLGVDAARAFGIADGSFNISALHVHGSNLSALNLNTLQTASGIEADRGARLWELWYQQGFLNNHVDLKLGQQSIDQEFMVSQYSGLFVNTMMGWPAVPSYDMPAGGPAYPMSAVGARLRVRPTGALTLLTGVYDGDPTAAGDGNKHGTAFSLHGGALWVTELQYSNQPSDGAVESGDQVSSSLPGTYKLGFWYHNASFADQRWGVDGRSLADPASQGAAEQHRGNYSVYAVADQLVWEDKPGSQQGLGVFARAMAAPGDRNQLSFSINTGLVLKEPFQGRDNDSVGLGLGYARVGSGARALDRDAVQFSGVNTPVRSGETFVEATYQYQVNPWWQVQGDVQYVVNPGAGIVNPNNASGTQKIGNELVLGVRTNISF